MSEGTGRRLGTNTFRAVVATLLTLAAISVSAAAAAGAEAREGFPDREFGDYGRATAFESGSRELHMASGGNGTVVVGKDDFVLRFDANGERDESFGDEGKATIPDLGEMPFEIADVDVDAEGRILAFGAVVDIDTILGTPLTGATSPTHAAVVRLDRTGNIDPEFGEDGYFVDDFGAGGISPAYDKPITRANHGRVRPDGSLLILIGVGELEYGARHIAVATPSRLVAVLAPDGEIDRGVGKEGVLIDNPKVSDIPHFAVYPDSGTLVRAELKGGGKLLVRLRPDGRPDSSFGNKGFLGYGRFKFDAIGLGPDGHIAMANDREVILLAPDGQRDRNFGRRGRAAFHLAGRSRIEDASIGDLGRVLLSGTQIIRKRRGAPNAMRRSFTVVALDDRGRPDRGFGRGGWVSSRFGPGSSATADAATLDGEGHLVVGGFVLWPRERRAVGLIRYDLGD